MFNEGRPGWGEGAGLAKQGCLCAHHATLSRRPQPAIVLCASGVGWKCMCRWRRRRWPLQVSLVGRHRSKAKNDAGWVGGGERTRRKKCLATTSMPTHLLPGLRSSTFPVGGGLPGGWMNVWLGGSSGVRPRLSAKRKQHKHRRRGPFLPPSPAFQCTQHKSTATRYKFLTTPCTK